MRIPTTQGSIRLDDQLAVELALVTLGSRRRTLDELDREEALVYVGEVCGSEILLVHGNIDESS